MKKVVILLICQTIGFPLFAQSANLILALSDSLPMEKKNVFNLKVGPYGESRIKEISGEKFIVHSGELEFNGRELEPKSIKTRGKSTLFFTRKSFSISLKDPILLCGEEVKKMALNNLVMDRNYFRNRLSFLLMEHIGIFRLQNEYAEVRINGKSSGLYLAIQKPEDYARSLGSPLLVRREYEERFTVEDSDGDTKQQMKRLKSIPKLTREFQGQELYDSLNVLVCMDHYFQWLAFNYLVKNGDYTDELFLYLNEDENRFDIIPWDYDDIFMQQPHESFEKRNKVLDHKLLFSGEEYLDIVIDRDEFLYMKFLDSFESILEMMDPVFLKSTFEEVYAELLPYYKDPEVIAQSENDQFGYTDLRTLQADLQNHFQLILRQRKSIQEIIAAEMERISL